MWGAGAVIAELQALGIRTSSPEADAAVATYRDVKGRIASGAAGLRVRS